MAVHEPSTGLGLQLVLGGIEDPETFSPTLEEGALGKFRDVHVGTMVTTAAGADRAAQIDDEFALSSSAPDVAFHQVDLAVEDLLPGSAMPYVPHRKGVHNRPLGGPARFLSRDEGPRAIASLGHIVSLLEQTSFMLSIPHANRTTTSSHTGNISRLQVLFRRYEFGNQLALNPALMSCIAAQVHTGWITHHRRS